MLIHIDNEITVRGFSVGMSINSDICYLTPCTFEKLRLACPITRQNADERIPRLPAQSIQLTAQRVADAARQLRLHAAHTAVLPTATITTAAVATTTVATATVPGVQRVPRAYV